MAKHPHKLQLINAKTWKCVLEGCAFFVHLGLAHVLIGKHAVCWDCDETFTIDEYALTESQPRCLSCRTGGVPLEEIIEQKIVEKVTPSKRERTDGIEVIEPDDIPVEHAADCSVWLTDSCDCGAE